MALSKSAKFRLRSLQDLRIVRAPMGDNGFTELVQAGLAARRYIPHPGRDSFKCDFTITTAGALFPSEALR